MGPLFELWAEVFSNGQDIYVYICVCMFAHPGAAWPPAAE